MCTGSGGETTYTCVWAAPQERLSSKYEEEGASAIFHATALAFPGSRLQPADDTDPPRLQIVLPSRAKAEPGVLGSGRQHALGPHNPVEPHLYSCKNCLDFGRMSACLSPETTYHSPLVEYASRITSADMQTLLLTAVCLSIGYAVNNSVEHFRFQWWCGELWPMLASHRWHVDGIALPQLLSSRQPFGDTLHETTAGMQPTSHTVTEIRSSVSWAAYAALLGALVWWRRRRWRALPR